MQPLSTAQAESWRPAASRDSARDQRPTAASALAPELRQALSQLRRTLDRLPE